MRPRSFPRLPQSLSLLGALCLLALAGAPAFGQGFPPPASLRARVDLDENAILISGLSPSAPIAWFGVQRDVDVDFSVSRSTLAGLAVGEADGKARIEFQAPLVRKSIWVVVDLATGAHRSMTPDDFPLAVAQEGHGHLAVGEGGAPDALLEDRPEVTGLVVRPGVGAWRFAAADGGGDDEDGENDGSLRVPLPFLQPLDGSLEPPETLAEGDLWFVIDPVVLDVAVLEGEVNP